MGELTIVFFKQYHPPAYRNLIFVGNMENNFR